MVFILKFAAPVNRVYSDHSDEDDNPVRAAVNRDLGSASQWPANRVKISSDFVPGNCMTGWLVGWLVGRAGELLIELLLDWLDCCMALAWLRVSRPIFSRRTFSVGSLDAVVDFVAFGGSPSTSNPSRT